MQTRAFVGVVACGLSFLGSAQSPDISTRSVVDRAAAYVRDYQQQLKLVVADEIYDQRIADQQPRDPDQLQTRRLKSDVFFMFAPPGHGWMTIRDVIEVDGHRVAERPDALDALRRLSPHEVAQRFKTYNSRYNLGRTMRDFNEPTLGLLVLSDEHRSRFSFDRKRIEQTPDLIVVLAFRERERPTLIRGVKQGAVFSRGELVVEAATGVVRRTTIAANADNVQFELSTDYAHDQRLGMLVPTRFVERYEYGQFANRQEAMRSATEHERIVCEAAYSNYRRFETAVRIK